MTSKEALEKIKERLFLKENDYVKTFIPCILKIYQDLNRLEKLEKDFEELKELNQFNYKSVKCEEHNYKLLENEYIKLEKENQKLKERYKHRAETSNDLCKEVRQYEKAFEILQSKKVSIELLSKTNNVNQYNRARHLYDKSDNLTQEEYELLKEMVGNAKDN